jgi:hypothetical protein
VTDCDIGVGGKASDNVLGRQAIVSRLPTAKRRESYRWVSVAEQSLDRNGKIDVWDLSEGVGGSGDHAIWPPLIGDDYRLSERLARKVGIGAENATDSPDSRLLEHCWRMHVYLDEPDRV